MLYAQYALCNRNDRFWLIGPFATHAGVAEWCRDPLNNPEDDPRWQNIRLPDAQVKAFGPALPIFPPRFTFDEMAVRARYRPVETEATDACSLSPTTADTMASTAQACASVAAIVSGLPLPEDDCPVQPEHYEDECYWFRNREGRLLGYREHQLTDDRHLATLFGGDIAWLNRHFPSHRVVTAINGSAEKQSYFKPVLAAAWLIRRCEEAGTPPS